MTEAMAIAERAAEKMLQLFVAPNVTVSKQAAAIIAAEVDGLVQERDRLRNDNATEYVRGRNDQQQATTIQSPTWRDDVMPLRMELDTLRTLAKAAMRLLVKVEQDEPWSYEDSVAVHQTLAALREHLERT